MGEITEGAGEDTQFVKKGKGDRKSTIKMNSKKHQNRSQPVHGL